MLTRDELKEGLRLELVAADGDAKRFSPEFQDALRDTVQKLEDDGTRLSPRFFVMDAVDAGGGMTGELTVLVKTFGPSTVAILVAWLHGRYGRKVKLKITETSVEAEAATPEELEKLLAMAKEHKRDIELKRIIS